MGEALCLPPPAILWFGVAQAFTRLAHAITTSVNLCVWQLLWIYVSDCGRHYILVVIHCLSLLHCSHTTFLHDLWALEKRVWYRCPICGQTFHILLLPAPGPAMHLCVYSTFYKNKLLWRQLRDTLAYNNKSLEVSEILYLFRRIVVVNSVPKVYDLYSHRFLARK